MANITTDNINTIAQAVASMDDGDYIYIYKGSGQAMGRITKAQFIQGLGIGTGADVISNVNAIQSKFDALIDALGNYAFLNGKNDNMKVGTLSWDEGQGGSVTPSPSWTSPTSGSTVDVGTNTGSGVSKTITVKGVNLTQPLSVSVSSGFSVSPTTISASAANTGTSVTVTYSGNTVSATGTLTISSSEVNVTVNLTATYAEESVTPEPTTGYVPDGLVLHLDGKNQGSTNGSWIDSKGLKEFVLQGDAAVHKDGNNQADGVQFDGDTSHATFDAAIYSGSTSSFPTFENGTIEVVFTPLTGFISGGRPLFVTNNANGTYDICAHWVKTNNQFCFVSSETTTNAKNATAPLPNTFSDGDMQVISATMNNGNYLIVQNGVSSTGTPTVSSSSSNKKSGAGRLRLGSMMDNTLTDRCSPVIIHEVRVYSGHLTEQQMKDNQAVDAERYGVILANS